MLKFVLITVLLSGSLLVSPLFAIEHQSTNPRADIQSPHGALARSCEDCHTQTSWRPMRNFPEFNHNDTKYPLRGMHKDVGCRRCHADLVFAKVGMKCADCHADLHRRQLGANCEQCHTVKGWQVSTNAVKEHFNRFPLTGMHAVVQCDACHRNFASGQFQGLSTTCYACHQTDYRTPVLDHVSGGFPTNCTDCHSMDSWLGAKFDHLKFTGFALVGIHATLDCSSCHTGGRYKGVPANCYACHQKDFTGAANPNHVQAGLPHDCGICHTSLAWSPATFDHAAFTKFPLTGAHAALQCSQCHVNGNYNITTTSCASCHIQDYNKTTNPNHKTGGFPTDCSICHSTIGWIPASFDHSKTGFPLTGAHATVACASCHINGHYSNTPVDCYSCHAADYKNVSNPNHVASGFPTTCATCHTTTTWLGATFNHTWFPIYTGAHAGKWVTCNDCHVNPADYSAFSCITCHTHDKSVVDPHHTDVKNYTYTPTSCYSCHRNGSAGG